MIPTIEISHVVKAILEDEFGVECTDIAIYLEVFDKLRRVEDPRVLLHSPYDSYLISVTSLRWKENYNELTMDSLDILCTVSSSGRVLQSYKIVGPRDTDTGDLAYLDKSDEQIAAIVRNAFGRCIRRTRRYWIFSFEEKGD